MAQVRHITRLEYGSSLPAGDRLDGDVAVFGSNGPVGRHNSSNTGSPVVVVGRKGSHGKLQYSPNPVFAIDTTYFIDPTCTQANIRWLFYSLSTLDLDKVGQDVGVPGLSREYAYSQRVHLPSHPEQRAIADYLGTETSRIDTLITKKRRMIELLSKRWRNLRRRVILRGLNPVQGGGLVEPWDEMNLGVLIELQRGHDLPSSARVEGDVPVVSSGGVSGWHEAAIADGPGVITGRYGTIGEVFYVGKPYWPLNTTLYVKDFRGTHPRWVYHLLAAIPLDIDSQKSAVGGINRNVVGSLRVPRPSHSTQLELATYLDEAEEVTSKAREHLQAQIDLLAERRQALITSTVTGELAVPVDRG